jgi:DNA polymerase
MRTIVIDFETVYGKDYTLRKLSIPEYIHDPRFKVLGLAVDDGETQYFLKPEEIPAALEEMKGDILVMHNAYFDAAILAWRYNFRPAYLIDTLLLANHVLGSARETGSRNDLASLAEKLGFEAKGRLEFMKDVTEPDDGQWAMLEAYAKTDVRITRQVLNHLLPQVTNPEFELWLLDHTVRIYTDKLLNIDVDKVRDTMQRVEARHAEYLEASGVPVKLLASNKQFQEELAARLKRRKIKLPRKRAAVRKDGSAPMIVAMAKGDPAFLRLADSDHPEIAALVKARLVVKSAATIQARLKRMETYANLGGIPVHLVYYGAHTGRFSGAGGFNFQNLTSPARAADPVERDIASAVRSAITAGEGRKFVAVDAAQIEARVLAWLADEPGIYEPFREGHDIYSLFISGVLGEDIHKPRDGDPEDQVPYLKLMRHVGKESILGLGYSMGVDKFVERLRKEKSILPLLTPKGKLSPEVCETIVSTYRETYANVPKFWRDLNNAFEAAVRGATRRVGEWLVVRKAGPRAVQIVLPSGRALFYRELRLVEEKNKYGKPKKVWKHGGGQRVYGGLLAENVVQAVARDILAEAILATEQAGYPVVLSIHDEVVARVPEEQAEECLAFLIDALSTPPAWAEGDRNLVLAAEGHIANDLSK